MQLANHSEPVWYFIFGPKEKSSLSAQYALQHHLQHLINPSETTLKEHALKGLIAQASPQLFRKMEAWKQQLAVIFLKGALSEEQAKIKRDYESIGKCITIEQFSYASFRKQMYPKIIVLYGPDLAQNQAVSQNYLHHTGYLIVNKPVTANEVVQKYPKNKNYVFLAFQPELAEVNILQTYFNLKIIHLKHLRTKLTGYEKFFDREAVLVPQLQRKPYFYTIDGSSNLIQLLVKIGENLSPQLIYVNVQEGQEREKIRRYVEQSGSLLLNTSEILSVYKRKSGRIRTEADRLDLLVNIVFRNLTRNTIYFTEFPTRPDDIDLLERRTRPFKLFADCLSPEKYQPSQGINNTIYFLQTLRRKCIEADFPFQRQITSFTKYLTIAGPPCAGKTSAAKFIAAELGYRHIEYEPYLASIKEKLIAPEDGEELPFHKVIKHFGQLIANSDNSPLVIDGLNVDWKDIDNWVKNNGPPTVLNLKVDEKELIRRTRKKNEADLAAEVTEEETAKIKQAITKNTEWAEQMGARCPLATIYQIDFSQQLILAQRLLEQVLRPKVFLIQDNTTMVFQNISIRYNMGFFDLRWHSIKEVSDIVRKGHFRNVVLCNYTQKYKQLICQDVYEIQKFIGPIRYLAIWNPEAIELNDEKLQLEAPQKPEKPKAAENEEGEAPPPPAEEEGEAKKKALNIYDYEWTKPGNQKNLSQWFFSQKKQINKRQSNSTECYTSFGEVLKMLSENKDISIYHKIA